MNRAHWCMETRQSGVTPLSTIPDGHPDPHLPHARTHTHTVVLFVSLPHLFHPLAYSEAHMALTHCLWSHGLIWQLVAIIGSRWYRLKERLIHTNVPQQTHFKPQRPFAFQLATKNGITNPVPSIRRLQTHFNLNMGGGDSPKWIETMLLSVLYGWKLNQTNYSLCRHHLVLIVWGKSYRVWVYRAQKACTLKQSELASSSGLQIKLCENYTHLRNTCMSVFREKDKQHRLCYGWNWTGSGDGNK